MAESYDKFLDFDWANEGWQTYLSGLYPTPKISQILKFKKKWYKRNIDKDFDETYDPPTIATTTTSGATTNPEAWNANPFMKAAAGDGDRWATKGPKGLICFAVYTVALGMTVAAAAGAFPPYQALVALVAAFVLEIVAKYGIKFKTEWLQAVLMDDVGVMPTMLLTLLAPGMHPVLRICALVPPFLTAVLSFAQISQAHERVPRFIHNFFAPLSETSARYQVMQVRADIEVGLGVILLVSVFLFRSAPLCALLFWNFMILRYMISPWTQASFRKIDSLFSPVLSRIPLVSTLYTKTKNLVYSFVDPSSKRKGMCSIL
uniref:Uncharacterized protein n=1 Tax=Noctiluca scintillans TaxID=2966 RepID=A0A7S1AJV5_NOCSC|mmetsp:Transcript_49287/g.130597  ORF Transcript_49287/g.130597 Transcript_49287/m.130597 type:complete len:318 (+) Transcript_49287:104-1057(+)|eukprot:CAMPEP_0194517014 /NCGR_PEP_ID=MMETSP0253-20130528/50067_1 /TAXON_ID=2966 /ORGANISM="Noctiluca scintillans" /LENGTH=317 /DNA_ID=CAMNT_0039360931 /DNA_START=78 /DNA_END=1031 /DNA_ORIENTATION=+